jgi:BolA protein
MDRVAWLESALRRAFTPDHLEVVDESALHAGHAGAGSGGHFRVVVVSGLFRSQDLLTRQRAVYAVLGAAMKSEVHALALRTLTPEEWAQDNA